MNPSNTNNPTKQFLVRLATESDRVQWDDYVQAHPQATLYHLSGWKNVIEKTYGHTAYYLIASRFPHSDYGQPNEPGDQRSEIGGQRSAKKEPNEPNKPDQPNKPVDVVGILPMIHLKHFLFGNHLVSIPFFDMGGILAETEEVEKALLAEAVNLARGLKATSIELRHTEERVHGAKGSRVQGAVNPMTDMPHAPCSMPYAVPRKVRMFLRLPESSALLMKSFKAKLRSQIKKPMKEGLRAVVGGMELLDDFYTVFVVNMRDLGSPVHAKQFISIVLTEFADKARMVIVYKDKQPLACSMVVGFKDTLENPWSSSLREYSSLSPNMLLYWTMLEYACDHGYRFFDFGRSSPDEGTYKFKEQWGAAPSPFHWQYISLNGNSNGAAGTDKSKYQKAIRYWQKLPVPVTALIGPLIRKHISL